MILQHFFLVQFPELSAQTETELRVRLSELNWKCQHVPKGLRKMLIPCKGNPHLYVFWRIQSPIPLDKTLQGSIPKKSKSSQTLHFLQSWKEVQKSCASFQGSLYGAVLYDMSQQTFTMLSKQVSEYASRLTLHEISLPQTTLGMITQLYSSLQTPQKCLLFLLHQRSQKDALGNASILNHKGSFYSENSL